MILLQSLKKLWSLIGATGFLWKLARHYGVLKMSIETIETTLSNMSVQGRKVPDHDEAAILLKAVSNILKTGVIDIPGIDEANLAINLDYVANQFSLSITDAASGKFYQLPKITKIAAPEVEVKNEHQSI